MNSSPNSTEPEATAGVRQPLAADGGNRRHAGAGRNAVEVHHTSAALTDPAHELGADKV